MKSCTKCKLPKTLDKFSPKNRNKRGSWCRECNKKAVKLYFKKSPWKRTYNAIKSRCNNPNHKHYKYYGGKGIKSLITVGELKILWFRDKAYLMEIPSIDREDNDGNYTFDNCSFMEQKDNSKKIDRTNQIKKLSKSINQYDLEGNFIRSWKNAYDIYRTLGFSHGNISSVCLRKRKTANGFIWRFNSG